MPELWLALFDEEPPHPAARPVGNRAGADSIHATVIVVDDDEPGRRITARLLREEGHNVIEAHSAFEALHRLRLLKDVRVVLADIAMPQMNGLQLAEIVSTDFPGVSVILMSGYTSLLPRVGSREAKFPLLMKPFTGEQLARQIRSMLGGEQH
ncbi:MAG TPA: response regulator [Gemmatimonadales bacterium]|nr:response regulator [Gemmatimonadales bacterium]